MCLWTAEHRKCPRPMSPGAPSPPAWVRYTELVYEMVWGDLADAQRDELCRQEGLRVMGNGE